MKRRIPAKTVDACDICQREGGLLKTCLVCAKKYCHLCQNIIFGCMIPPQVCHECGRRDDVRRVVERYAEQIVPIVKERATALKQLGKGKRT